jgi:hypothetical protein
MAFEAQRQAIEVAVSSNWTATVVEYQNVAFERPSDEWARLTVHNGKTHMVGVSGVKRQTGVMFFQIFAKPNTGTATPKGRADTFVGLFENKTISGVSYETASMDEHKDEEWYWVTIKIPFTMDMIE